MRCIWYPTQFLGQKGQVYEVKALLNSKSEVNAMISTYTAKLSLKSRPTNVGTQKINGSTLKTYIIILASFLL